MRLSSAFTLVLIPLICGSVGAGGEEPENIIQNGDFEAQFQSWLFWTEGGAVAERQIDSKKVDPIDGRSVAYVKIGNGGGGFNHIQFYQGPFTLKKGKEYTFCVWGKSDGEPRPVQLRVLHHENPWTNYAMRDVTFNDSWNEYTVTFTQPVDDNVARVDLFLGTSKVDVWLDHVRLYEGEYFNDEVWELPDQQVDSQGKLAAAWGAVKTRCRHCKIGNEKHRRDAEDTE